MSTHKITRIEEVEKGWKIHLDKPGPDGKPYIVTAGKPGSKVVVGAELTLTPPTPLPSKPRR